MLILHVKTRKNEKKNSVTTECTIDQRDCRVHGIEAGDVLTAQIVQHVKRVEDEE